MEVESKYPDLPPRYDDPRDVPMSPADAHWIFTGTGYNSGYAHEMLAGLAEANIELTGDNVRGWMQRPEHRRALQEQSRYSRQHRPDPTGPQEIAERGFQRDRLVKMDEQQIEQPNLADERPVFDGWDGFER